MRALERAHGLGARGRRQDLGTCHGQHLGGYLAVELVVFGDDDAPAGEIVRNSVAVRSGPRGERIVARGGSFARGSPERHVHREGRPLPHLARQRYTAAHHLREPLRDGKAQTRASASA